MAQLLSDYIKGIEIAKDYEQLSNAVDHCISNNTISAVIPNIKGAIDRLGVDSPYDSFIHVLAWSVTTTDHHESILELLKYFCNKLAASYNSLMYQMNDFSLAVFCVCVDDKDIIKSFTSEQKFSLVYNLSGIDLDKMVNSTAENGLGGYETIDQLKQAITDYLLTSIEYALNLKTLDGVKKALDNDLPQNESIIYVQYIQPFMKDFLNMLYNTDQLGILTNMMSFHWSDYIYRILEGYAERYSNKFGGDIYDWKYCISNLVVEYKEALNELSTTGYEDFPNAPMGRFIIWYCRDVDELYNETRISKEQCTIVLCDMRTICERYFSANTNYHRMLQDFIMNYITYGYECVFMEDKYYKSLSMHLNNDESFKLWLELVRDDMKEVPIKNIYASYFKSVAFCDKTDDNIIIDYDTATEAKTEQWKYEDDDEDEEEKKKEDDEEGEEDSKGEDQNDEDYDGPEIDASQSTKGYKKHSKNQAEASKKIYKAYKTYKDNEAKVDSQLSKMITSMKNAFTQDKTEEIIEGKRFSPIGILKKALLTSAIFSYSKIAGIIYLVTSHALNKKRTAKQKQDIIMQMNSEIEMLDEKIEDARGDGNRKAKYALMRTRTELTRARDKIKYNLKATKEDMATAKKFISKKDKDNEL